jgi:hypothetical protein
MVRGHVWIELDESYEPSGDRIGVSHGARSKHGAGRIHRTCATRADELRGDRVGVGDIGQVPWWAWIAGHSAGINDGRSPGSKCDTRLVAERGRAQLEPSSEQSRDGICVGDSTWSQHGAGDTYRQGAGGPDGLRGHRVGVGDIGAVPDGTRSKRHSTSGDDGRGAGSKCDTGVVSGHDGTQHDSSGQPRSDGLSIGDGAWVKYGACLVHRQGTGGADGVRGNGVGVGDVSELLGDAWGWGDTAHGDNGRRAGRKHDTGMVGGLGRGERGA